MRTLYFRTNRLDVRRFTPGWGYATEADDWLLRHTNHREEHP